MFRDTTPITFAGANRRCEIFLVGPTCSASFFPSAVQDYTVYAVVNLH